MNFIGAMDSNSLERYGINLLTGEADALGLRILSDVNADGKKLLQNVLGTLDLSLMRKMNSRVNGQPSVGSVFIPHDLLPLIKIVALFMQPGVLEVWEMSDGGFRGMDAEGIDLHEEWEQLRDTHGLSRADWERWYELRSALRTLRNPPAGWLEEFHKLDYNYRHYCGVVKVYRTAPRNGRGPAGDSTGLTHHKVM